MTIWGAGAFMLLSYGLGGLLAGYWIGMLKDGRDLRTVGSGNPGARNAGRIYGRAAFLWTFAGDAAKGALAVGCAKSMDAGPVFALAVFLAVVLGHVFPALLAFRGGKGMSVFCGGALLFDWTVWLAMIGVAGILLLVFRAWTPAGLCGVGLFPVLVLYTHQGQGAVVPLLALAITAVIGYAHRGNIKQVWTQQRS
ncbi:glycerol-3-phosphate acyltransferase [Paenibacillus filicis]|uniref:Glycerol-3-phosphate acyltransferase n=1 Tax=Paenibacillus filicis TaxID=669464 RepID=A0ABU9DPH6_9BACL